jgi:hypothetical protein
MAGLKENHFLSQRKDTDCKKSVKSYISIYKLVFSIQFSPHSLSTEQTVVQYIFFKFWCPSRHSFYLFFEFSVYSIDTIFIHGDGLIRLLLLWNRLLLLWNLLLLHWKNLLRCFSAPGFSWAEPREGCRAGFEPGTAVQQPDVLTPKPRRTPHKATPHPDHKATPHPAQSHAAPSTKPRRTLPQSHAAPYPQSHAAPLALSLLSVMMEFHKTPYPRAGKTGSVDYLPVDKTFSRSGGLCKKHKKWREMKVVNFWHSSSGETCSN